MIGFETEEQFQSTFPRGERPEGGGFAPLKKVISIHVPAWGTTTGGMSFKFVWQFQSTFPRGERLISPSTLGIDTKFQSTFPRGERQENAGSSQ